MSLWAHHVRVRVNQLPCAQEQTKKIAFLTSFSWGTGQENDEAWRHAVLARRGMAGSIPHAQWRLAARVFALDHREVTDLFRAKLLVDCGSASKHTSGLPRS